MYGAAAAQELEQVVLEILRLLVPKIPQNACQSVLEQDTEPWRAVGTFHGSHRHQYVNWWIWQVL